MPYLNYIVTPLIGAVIGYLTNWLAIRMLFRPHSEKRVFGIKIPFTPGLIPKERARLTEKIADTVSAFVLTPDVLAKELSSASVWSLPDITVGELLAQFGVTDPTPAVERIALDILRDERVRHTLVNASTQTTRSAVDALREKLLAEGATLGGLLPEAFTSAVKDKAADWLPMLITYLRRWPEENPWLDEKLSDMLRRIIDENLGRLVGLFIDHKKIYANIKEGLLNYLDDADNQLYFGALLRDAADTFCAQEIRGWAEKLPDGCIDRTIDAAEEKLAAFLSRQMSDAFQTSLPAPFSEAIKRLVDAICAIRLTEVAAYMAESEKKAAQPVGSRFKHALEKAAAYVAEHMQIRQMIVNKLNAFAVEEVEHLILSVVSRELQAITVLGGVLGFIIGLASVLPRLFVA